MDSQGLPYVAFAVAFVLFSLYFLIFGKPREKLTMLSETKQVDGAGNVIITP